MVWEFWLYIWEVNNKCSIIYGSWVSKRILILRDRIPKWFLFLLKVAPGRPKTGLRPPSAASAGAARDQGVEAEVNNSYTWNWTPLENPKLGRDHLSSLWLATAEDWWNRIAYRWGWDTKQQGRPAQGDRRPRRDRHQVTRTVIMAAAEVMVNYN